MKLRMPRFVIRPKIAVLGVILSVIALIGLFCQRTEQTQVYGSHVVRKTDMNLHEMIIDVPVGKEGVPKTTCNLSVGNDFWSVLLLTHPGNNSELVILGNSKVVLRHKCTGVLQGDFYAFRLHLYDGMVILESGNGRDSFPARGFSMNTPLRIKGVCAVEFSGSYKTVFAVSSVVLALAVVCFIIALAPRFDPARPYNRGLLSAGIACVIGEAAALMICFYHMLSGKDFYPYNTFLFRPFTVADDLFQTFLPVRHAFLPYGWIGAGNYFPFTYSFLSLMPLHNFCAAAAVIYALFAVVSASFALNTVRPKNFPECALLLFLTWGTLPSLLLWVSGNLEMLVFVIVVFAVFSLRKRPALSAFLIAAALNIKLYPGVLGALFFTRKQYKNAFLCFFFSLALFVFAMASQSWNFAKPLMCFKHFSDVYTVFVNDGLIFSHSLFSLYRYIGCHFFGLNAGGIRAALPYYYLFCALLLAVIVWIAVKYPLRFWEKLFLLLGAAVLLPPVSFDHTLILLLPALWVFLKRRAFCKPEKLYTLCWVLILIPENWYHSQLWAELQISVLIKPVALLVMIIAIMAAAKLRGLKIRRGSGHPAH